MFWATKLGNVNYKQTWKDSTGPEIQYENRRQKHL